MEYGPAYRQHCYKQKTARGSGSQKMQNFRRIVKSENADDLNVFYMNRKSASRKAKLYQWHCARMLRWLSGGANSNHCFLDNFRRFIFSSQPLVASADRAPPVFNGWTLIVTHSIARGEPTKWSMSRLSSLSNKNAAAGHVSTGPLPAQPH